MLLPYVLVKNCCKLGDIPLMTLKDIEISKHSKSCDGRTYGKGKQLMPKATCVAGGMENTKTK